jgi:hypothetical protein
MIQLRLTDKLRKQIGVKPSVLSEPQVESTGLGHWTLNLFTVGRRKAVIFVNDKTLYSFVLYGLRKDNPHNFDEVFLNGLVQLLTFDEFTDQQIKLLLSEYTEIEYTKTNSRQVLGNINDLIFHYQYLIDSAGGLEYADLGEIIHRLNRMPQRNIGWGYSVDAVRGLLKNS